MGTRITKHGMRGRKLTATDHARTRISLARHLVEPDGRKDEEQLYEHRTEWQDTTHDDRERRLHVPNLLRDLPRYLVDTDWELNILAPVAKIRAQENERHRNTKPKDKQREESTKRHSARRLFPERQEHWNSDRASMQSNVHRHFTGENDTCASRLVRATTAPYVMKAVGQKQRSRGLNVALEPGKTQ